MRYITIEAVDADLRSIQTILTYTIYNKTIIKNIIITKTWGHFNLIDSIF